MPPSFVFLLHICALRGILINSVLPNAHQKSGGKKGAVFIITHTALVKTFLKELPFWLGLMRTKSSIYNFTYLMSRRIFCHELWVLPYVPHLVPSLLLTQPQHQARQDTFLLWHDPLPCSFMSHTLCAPHQVTEWAQRWEGTPTVGRLANTEF